MAPREFEDRPAEQLLAELDMNKSLRFDAIGSGKNGNIEKLPETIFVDGKPVTLLTLVEKEGNGGQQHILNVAKLFRVAKSQIEYVARTSESGEMLDWTVLQEAIFSVDQLIRTVLGNVTLAIGILEGVEEVLSNPADPANVSRVPMAMKMKARKIQDLSRFKVELSQQIQGAKALNVLVRRISNFPPSKEGTSLVYQDNPSGESELLGFVREYAIVYSAIRRDSPGADDTFRTLVTKVLSTDISKVLPDEERTNLQAILASGNESTFVEKDMAFSPVISSISKGLEHPVLNQELLKLELSIGIIEQNLAYIQALLDKEDSE